MNILLTSTAAALALSLLALHAAPAMGADFAFVSIDPASGSLAPVPGGAAATPVGSAAPTAGPASSADVPPSTSRALAHAPSPPTLGPQSGCAACSVGADEVPWALAVCGALLGAGLLVARRRAR